MSTHIINFPGADIHTTTITSVSNVSVGENLDVASNLTVSGNTAVSQELSVSGNVEVGTANLFVDTTTGNVGVGVAHPTSAKLQVAGSLGMAKGSEFFAGDDVVMELPKHDRPLTMYPEIKMTANSFAGYVASASSYYNINNYPPYEAFDRVYGTELNMWISRNYSYLSDGNVDTANVATFQGVYGEYLSLSMPNKIKLEKIRVHSRNNTGASQSPENGRIYGSNDNSTWTQIGTYTGLNMLHNDYRTIIVNASEYYKDYTFQIEKMKPFGPGAYTCIAELEYHGTEEGDTSVDVVHRSIPNKPGQQHLEVYWDANDSNSYSFADSSSVYDLSGSGVKGTLTNGVGFDTEYNAFTFDGVDDYITTTLTNPNTDWVHSVSMWVYPIDVSVDSVNGYMFAIGPEVSNQVSALRFSPDGFQYTRWTGGGAKNFNGPVTSGRWHHVTLISPGSTGVQVYLDGRLLTSTSDSLATLTLPQNTSLSVGRFAASASYSRPFNGSIANFRLFSKALNADQVRELYEYDAPRFGHRQNLVSLHKGNLGVGVAHPTSRFEVAGADGLQEYPPRAMTANETYIPGHGVFRASANSEQNGAAWKAFNKTDATGEGWVTDVDEFVADTGYSNTSTATTNTIFGRCSFLAIETPGLIKLEKIRIQPDVNNSGSPDAHDLGMPKDFQIWARKGGTEWTQIAGYTDQIFLYLTGSTEYYDVNVNDYYSEFAIVVTRTHTSSSYSWTGGTSQFTRASIGEWSLFGTPAPSSLEDGHLTLGKTLTLPRVSGHPAGAETPRAESLIVHYDTTVDSVVSGSTAVDISGEGSNGTLNNGAAYSSTYRSLNLDATVDSITIGNIGNQAGAWVHSVSFWIYFLDLTSDRVFEVSGSTQDKIPHFVLESDGDVRWDFYASNIKTTSRPIAPGIWYHVALSYKGGVHGLTNSKIYINGVSSASEDNGSGNALNIDANRTFYIGVGTKQRISNFKIWGGVALTPEEVAMEYALGRTGKALNVTDTSLCLGGTVPRAQLDVRGSARFGGIMSYSVPYYFAQQENTGGYAYDEPIVYKTNVVTNYPGSFYSSATNNGYYIPPLPGVYQVHMTAIANGAGSIYIQKFNYVTDSVILYHDKTHFNFTSGGWESISASGLISIDDPGTQAIRIFADGSSGNGIWAYNSYHGCVSIVWVSNI